MSEFADAHWPDGHWPDGHWPDGHWWGPIWPDAPPHGYEALAKTLFDLRVATAGQVESVAADLFDRNLESGGEAVTAALFDAEAGHAGSGEAVAAELFDVAGGLASVEPVAAELFDAGTGLDSLESVAAALYDFHGTNDEMFAEAATYYRGATPLAINVVFQPGEPEPIDDEAGKYVLHRAHVQVSYDAVLGVESPVAYVDKIVVGGETWTVLPFKPKRGGHWWLPLTRRERRTARTRDHERSEV